MAWDKTRPAGSTAIKNSDQLLRENFAALEEGDVPFDYLQLSVQASDPTNAADTGFLYGKDVSSKIECHYFDEDGDAVQMTSGGKLGTAAAQIDTSGLTFDAGTTYLDTYVTGTWTPVLEGASVNPSCTFSVQNGWYTRIGDLVWITAHLICTSASGGSGQLRVGDFPYTSKTATNYANNLAIGLYNVGFNSSTAWMVGIVESNKDYCHIQENIISAAQEAVDASDLNSNSRVLVSGIYKV